MATALQTESFAAEEDDRTIPEDWRCALLSMSPEVYEFLDRLAEDSGKSKVEVIRKALSLYRLALDARREGLIVGAVTEDQELDTEFVGF